jgi:hypothetical protein
MLVERRSDRSEGNFEAFVIVFADTSMPEPQLDHFGQQAISQVVVML